MKRIETLSSEQTARFPEFIQRWTDIGLSTEPANRPEAERGVRIAYELAGKPPPEKIIWCGSPLSQGLTRAIIFGLKDGSIKVWASVRASVGDSVGASVGASVRDSVRDSVWDSVRDSVWDSVRASVRDSVWDSVGDSVGDSVWDSVGDSVRASVRDSVWDSVWASVGDSVGASVRDSVWASVRDSVGDSVGDSVWASVGDSVGDSVGASVGDSGYGQHDASWLAVYEYFAEAVGLGEQTQKLTGLWLIARNAGWFLPHEKICWIAERHNILRRDDRGRLHCENGPALSYPDGWSIYAVHGVRVPPRLIEHPELLTAAEIEKESNTEIRRVMIDRFGQERFLAEAGAIEVHRDDFGVLFRKELPGDEPIVMVKVVNSTAEPDGSFKDYFLRVPPQITTAREAVAWTFDLPVHSYELAEQT
jgi:hypothetical protein